MCVCVCVHPFTLNVDGDIAIARRSTRRQLAFLLGRQQFFYDVEEELDEIEDDDEELEQLRDLMANVRPHAHERE